MRKTSLSAKCSWSSRVERARRREVVPERLLDDQPHPALCAAPLARSRRRSCRSRAAAPRGSRRGCRPCRAPRRARRARARSSSSPVVVGEVERDVAHAGGELVPHVLAERVARVLLHGLLHPLAELVVDLLGARGADDAEPLRQQVAHRQRVERRHQLLRRQVARRAEDDEDARIRPPPQPQPLEQRVLLGDAHRPRRSLDGVAAELVAERRVHLRGERLVLPRGEAREERGRDHRHGHVLGDRLVQSSSAPRRSPRRSRGSSRAATLPPRRRRAAARAATSGRPTRSARCPAISCRSRSNSDFSITSKPSAYACISPYSIPLWTIFTKCPAPDAPTCA